MQNDMLKNTVAPWQEKGRWYHGVWDYSTRKFDPDKSDPVLLDTSLFEITGDGGANVTIYPLKVNGKRYSIIDVKYKALNAVTVSSNNNTSIGAIRTTTLGSTGRIFARSSAGISGGRADIWLFMDILEE